MRKKEGGEMDWLHWVGKQYYTQKSFIKEAKEFGVSRRVSLQQLKQMSWGDTVYTAMLDGKTGVVFGYFKVNKISGLDAETSVQIRKEHQTELIDNGGYAVNRGCGEYEAGPSYSIDTDIEEITREVEHIEYGEAQKSKPMVGGKFTEMEPIRLLDIPFRQGFRAINGIELRYQAEQNGNKVHGQFYLETATKLWYEHNKLQQGGEIQEVKKYNKNPNTRKKRQRKAIMPVQMFLF